MTAPCFKCGVGTRLPGHVVCASCHDERRCRRCHGDYYVHVAEHFQPRVSAHRTRPGLGGTT